MAEERRLERPDASEVVERDSRTERLLVDGLDRYFAGRYEEAIHLWTRVLFLDRSHARARAYIDRARTALAERQRRAEEMLQTTGELIDAGQIERARALLSQAVVTTGEDERAAAMRMRLERAERAGLSQPVARPAVVDAIRIAPVPVGTRRRRTMLALAGGALLALAVTGGALRSELGWGATPSSAPATASAVLPTLTSSEVALVRARTLYARGRLAEALRALERVDPDSANRTVADELRVEIQQILLAASRQSRHPGEERTAGQP